MATKKTTAKAATVKKTAEPLGAAVKAGKAAAVKANKTATVEKAARPAVAQSAPRPVETAPAPAPVETAPAPVQATAAPAPAMAAPVKTAPAPAKTVPAPAAKAVKAAFQGFGDFADVGKQNVEAFVASGNLFAKGMEDLGKELFDLTRRSFEGNVEATKAILGAKDFNQAVALQSELTKKNVDQFMAGGARLTELSVKVTNQAMEPIQARVDVAVKRIMKPIAA